MPVTFGVLQICFVITKTLLPTPDWPRDKGTNMPPNPISIALRESNLSKHESDCVNSVQTPELLPMFQNPRPTFGPTIDLCPVTFLFAAETGYAS